MDVTGGVKQEFQARKMKLHKGNLVEILGLKDAVKIKTNHWMKLMAENVQWAWAQTIKILSIEAHREKRLKNMNSVAFRTIANSLHSRWSHRKRAWGEDKENNWRNNGWFPPK